MFVPFASNDYDGYTKGCKSLLGNLDTNWSGLHEFEDPLAAIEAMDGIYVGGGNTWLLVRALHERGLIEPIREMQYCKEGFLTQELVQVQMWPAQVCRLPMIWRLQWFHHSRHLELFHFKLIRIIIPGGIWYRENEDGEFQQHFGETRARRVREYHQTNDIPVIGLYEGSFLRCRDDSFELLGNKAAVMRKDEEMEVLEPGTILRGDLTTA